jgi:phosphate transport system protein
MAEPVAHDVRHQYREELHRLEEQTMGGLELVVTQLDRAIEAIAYQDVELAAMVVADDDRIDGRYLEVHQGVLSMLALQAPVASDLRVVAALLHIIRCVERMGDQCVNILDLLEEMSNATRQQVREAREAFRTRHVSMAQDLVRQDALVNQLNRRIFQRAVDVGDEPELREWAMFMILVARCLERIGDNTVEIAEQTVFVVTGLFREFSGTSDAPS